jgi:hypothetical protein
VNAKTTPDHWHWVCNGGTWALKRGQYYVLTCASLNALKPDRTLIALAPEMAEALRKSLDWLASYPGEGAKAAYDQARAVLAKLEGGAS